MITLDFPCKTAAMNNSRVHWAIRSREVKAQRLAVWAEWQANVKRKPKLPCTVTFTRIAPRKLDVGDNLPSSMKACRDEIAKLLGVDDSTDQITWIYKQSKGQPKEYRVRIEITS